MYIALVKDSPHLCVSCGGALFKNWIKWTVGIPESATVSSTDSITSTSFGEEVLRVGGVVVVEVEAVGGPDAVEERERKRDGRSRAWRTEVSMVLAARCRE
jgi:hypothetical protein